MNQRGATIRGPSFPEAFKRKALEMSDESHSSVAKVARELGVSYHTLCYWRLERGPLPRKQFVIKYPISLRHKALTLSDRIGPARAAKKLKIPLKSVEKWRHKRKHPNRYPKFSDALIKVR